MAVEDVGCSLFAEATAADDNYTGSVRGVTPYPMQRRSIVVKAHDETGTYGEEIRTLTATIVPGSLVGGDTLDEIVTISTTATRNSTVGTYPITVTPKGHPGYDVTCIGGDIHHTKSGGFSGFNQAAWYRPNNLRRKSVENTFVRRLGMGGRRHKALGIR